jgi:hypothetical protein
VSKTSERLHRLRWEIRRLLETRSEWTAKDQDEYRSLTAMEAALLTLSDNDDGSAEARPVA